MSDKKQILIVFTGELGIGGIERSLISLLKNINYSKYSVDLFLYAHRGELFNQIPKQVNILPEIKELSYLRNSLSDKIKHGCFKASFWRLYAECKKSSIDDAYRHLLNFTIPKHYDLAISFFRPFDLIKKCVSADIKVGWIHTDYTVEEDRNAREDYRGLDKIVAVSDSVKQSFIKILPEYKDKVEVIENIYDITYIKQKSMQFIADMEIPKGDWIKILSVGRFTKAKSFERIPYIVSKLKILGINLKWYLIGWGIEESNIKHEIELNNVQDQVIVLGKKENPYPYMLACDVYIHPSLYEGKSVCVKEAQILGKPVIITDYPTSKSQLVDGYDGIIIPYEINDCIINLYDILSNKNKLERIALGVKSSNYDNSNEVEKVYALMGD